MIACRFALPLSEPIRYRTSWYPAGHFSTEVATAARANGACAGEGTALAGIANALASTRATPADGSVRRKKAEFAMRLAMPRFNVMRLLSDRLMLAALRSEHCRDFVRKTVSSAIAVLEEQ